MFLLATLALAGTNIGWPCQRLNWGWRNVWSTCSINSFAPAPAGSVETLPAQLPTGFRYAGAATPNAFQLSPAGVFTPSTGTTPSVLCNYAPNTGSGSSAALRNRCRRAIDAYGSLVRACSLTASMAPKSTSALVQPDFNPQAGHQPHVDNVRGLSHNAQFCLLPTGTVGIPSALGTPSTTCPGLLGWFTVVFNVCGFSNAPGLAPASQTAALAPQQSPNYFTATGITYAGLVGAAAATPQTGAGYFCVPAVSPTAATPAAYNTGGPNFRTSRCRKALDQFGRTAARCHGSQQPFTGPSQAGGYSDPLRLLAVGNVPTGAAATPSGINVWAPACNA